jgi:hypothetical protein
MQPTLQRRQAKRHIPVSHSGTQGGADQVGILWIGEKSIWVEVLASIACTAGSMPSTLRIMDKDFANTNIHAPNFAPSASMDSRQMPEGYWTDYFNPQPPFIAFAGLSKQSI